MWEIVKMNSESFLKVSAAQVVLAAFLGCCPLLFLRKYTQPN